ncbi:acyl dehydratase [Prauserella sediminis]|uniref:Acyl dehydratase n=1 Tax=Prauserella sediminis TaxID=577680 RepID=A0A839XWN3_9PSEU|nr:MaoC/PaaZ C-terminal domain-containing protein [Prauserella sediminis]MBB3664436.1 acyl dehydratase [Prauserella sediminis]
MSHRDGAVRVLVNSSDRVRTAEHDLDERWLRAFAVAVGDTRASFFDVDHPGGLVAHPLFPVCLEWPLIEHGPPGVELTGHAVGDGLHAAHRIRLHSPLRPGKRVRTESELYAAVPVRGSVRLTVEFRTYSDCGALMVTTHLVSFYRDVRLCGATVDRPLAAIAPPVGEPSATVASFAVDEKNAVVYSECARIWNPIHTDARVARAAGLPGPILHGTEILARAVSAITGSRLVPIDAVVTGIECRFIQPVRAGMTLSVVTTQDDAGPIGFQVLGPAGPVITHGRLTHSELSAQACTRA